MITELSLAPRRGQADQEELARCPLPHQRPPVSEAIEAAFELLPALEQARAAHSDIISKSTSAHRRGWAALSPIWAALISVAAVGLAAVLARQAGLGALGAGHFGAIVLASELAAFGAFAVVATRHAKDKSRTAVRRSMWLASSIAAIAGLLGLGADAVAAGNGLTLAIVTVPAAAGALPWMFAAMETEESRRLAAELDSATMALAATEEQVRAALLAAHAAFEAEIAPIADVLAGAKPQPADTGIIHTAKPQLAIASSEDADDDDDDGGGGDDDASWSWASDCGRFGIGPRARRRPVAPKKPVRWAGVGASACRTRR